MSQINVDNVAGLVPRETVLPDRGRIRGEPPEGGSFGSHFWRVQVLPQQPIAGGQADSTRLSQPPALAPDAARPSAQEREPAADDSRGARPGAAEVDSDENASGVATSPTENDGSETADARDNADNLQSSATAEPGSQTLQEQATDADPRANDAEQAEPRQAPTKPSRQQPNGQTGKDAIGESASDRSPADEAKKGGAAARTTASKKRTAGTTPLLKASPDQVTTQADPSLQHLRQQDTAAASVQAADKTAGRPADAPGGRSRSAKKAALVDKPSGVKQDSLTQASQPDAPELVPAPGVTEESPDGQIGRRGKPQPGHAALAVAAALRAATEAAAQRPAASEDDRTGRAGESKLPAPGDRAEPPPSAAADNRLSAPLRISPNPDSGAAPVPEAHQPGESVEGDRARFVQRVARAFQAAGKGGGSIRLRLSPPELGSLRLEIAVRNGLLSARVEAETPAARNLLLDNLPALRERLAQQDIKVKQFDVALMDGSAGGPPEQTADHAHSQRYGGSHAAPQRTADAGRDASPVAASGSVNRPGEGTHLNVVI